MSDESFDGFREYTVGELIEELRKRDPGEVVSIEARDPRGEVIVKELVQIKVDSDHDFDRRFGYQWTNIIGRLEPGDDSLPPEGRFRIAPGE